MSGETFSRRNLHGLHELFCDITNPTGHPNWGRLYTMDFHVPGEQEKSSSLKIQSIKSTAQIWIIQILVKGRKNAVLLWFFSLSYKQ